MSEIDMSKMVEMAGERAGWVLVNRKVITTPLGMDDIVTITRHTRDAQFIAKSPAAILSLHDESKALHQRVQGLETQNAALQAQVGEWKEEHDAPPMKDGYRSKAVIVTAYAQYHHKDGRWIISPRPISWRPLPDESPTAAESEG